MVPSVGGGVELDEFDADAAALDGVEEALGDGPALDVVGGDAELGEEVAGPVCAGWWREDGDDLLLEALLEASTTSDVTAVATEFQTTLADTYTPVVIAGGDATIRIDDVVAAAPSGTIAGNRPSGLWLLAPTPPHDLGGLLRAAHAHLVPPTLSHFCVDPGWQVLAACQRVPTDS